MSSDEESSDYNVVVDPKVAAFQDALKNRVPFYTGICPIQDYQRLLHYTDESGSQSR